MRGRVKNHQSFHFSDLKSKSGKRIKLAGDICPVCGNGRLENKIGIFGRFLGCNAFPKCRFTKNS
jgi:ssDNA-binding Zn-finger/Zn-ribbon topoisomerase 1